MPYLAPTSRQQLADSIRNLLITSELPKVDLNKCFLFWCEEEKDKKNQIFYRPHSFNGQNQISDDSRFALLDSRYFSNTANDWMSHLISQPSENDINEPVICDKTHPFVLLIPVAILSHPVGWIAIPVENEERGVHLLRQYFPHFRKCLTLHFFQNLINRFNLEKLKTLPSKSELVQVFCQEISEWFCPTKMQIKIDSATSGNEYTHITSDEQFEIAISLNDTCSVIFQESMLYLPHDQARQPVTKFDSFREHQSFVIMLIKDIFESILEKWDLYHGQVDPIRVISHVGGTIEDRLKEIANSFDKNSDDLSKAANILIKKAEQISTGNTDSEVLPPNCFYWDGNQWVIRYCGEKVKNDFTVNDPVGFSYIWLCLHNADKEFDAKILNNKKNGSEVRNIDLEEALSKSSDNAMKIFEEDYLKTKKLDTSNYDPTEYEAHLQKLMGYCFVLWKQKNKRDYKRLYDIYKKDVKKQRDTQRIKVEYDAALSSEEIYPIFEAFKSDQGLKLNDKIKSEKRIRQRVKSAIKRSIEKLTMPPQTINSKLPKDFATYLKHQGVLNLNEGVPYVFDSHIFPTIKWQTLPPKKK